MKAAKCPVCDWDIKDGGKTVKAGGGTVVVCCDDCAKAVKENPDKYAKAKQPA